MNSTLSARGECVYGRGIKEKYNGRPTDTPVAMSCEEHVDAVIKYIDENLGNIQTLREIAETTDVSYQTLRKAFRREKGLTIRDYLRRKRIDEMRRLLLGTDEPVSKVSPRVGYSSDSSAIRAFQGATGMTIQQYRRRYSRKGKSY